MAERSIKKYDEPVLRKKARPVKKMNKSVLSLLDDMWETMRAAEGVGLAATQVGALQRVVVVDVDEDPIELINPVIVARAGNEEGIEACLSVPGLMGEVERAERVTVKAWDRDGKPFWLDAEGLLARVVQHELDHLDGVVFVDRASSLTKIEPPPRLRAVFMGTSQFAVPALQALAKHHEVVAVVTRPDRPVGRRQVMVAPPVKETAEELELPVWQPRNCRSPEFREKLAGLEPEVLVVVSFGEILPQSILDIPALGAVNVHASLLPRYRGAAPIQHAIMKGDERTGVTLMKMARRLDAGDIILQASMAVEPDDTYATLEPKLARLGAKVLLKGLQRLNDDDFQAVPQPEERATVAPSLTREDERIEWECPAGELDKKIRALYPQPGAYVQWQERRLKLWQVRVVEAGAAVPGQILEVTDAGPLVACGQDALLLQRVQVSGKKPMDGGSFVRGYRLRPGDSLT